MKQLIYAAILFASSLWFSAAFAEEAQPETGPEAVLPLIEEETVDAPAPLVTENQLLFQVWPDKKQLLQQLRAAQEQRMLPVIMAEKERPPGPLVTPNQLVFQVTPDKKGLLKARRQQRAKIEDRFERLYKREKKLKREIKRDKPFVLSPDTPAPATP